MSFQPGGKHAYKIKIVHAYRWRPDTSHTKDPRRQGLQNHQAGHGFKYVMQFPSKQARMFAAISGWILCQCPDGFYLVPSAQPNVVSNSVVRVGVRLESPGLGQGLGLEVISLNCSTFTLCISPSIVATARNAAAMRFDEILTPIGMFRSSVQSQSDGGTYTDPGSSPGRGSPKSDFGPEARGLGPEPRPGQH
ncbi:hypothetical protein B0H13DRAFT_1870845 [Mycena leptocephala]|nr:hypothetical protein B0H13DRAFT_1870845 [Mycena leptocephala]